MIGPQPAIQKMKTRLKYINMVCEIPWIIEANKCRGIWVNNFLRVMRNFLITQSTKKAG